MPDVKISALPDASSVAGADEFVIVQSGTTKRVTASEIFASPPAIGGTTPAAGAFTTLSATGKITGTSAGGDYAVRAVRSSGDTFAILPQAAGSGSTLLGLNAAESDYEPVALWSESFSVQARTGVATVSQVALFNSTGLSVTGTLSSTGNLTVSGGTITTGSTTALSLATSGGTQFIIGHAASSTDYWQVQGSAGAGGEFYTVGGTNVNGSFKTKGSGYFSFATAYDSGGPEQVRITHTASANRYITLTGSNGGAPVIGTSAGDLAFSPAGSERLRIDASGNVGIGETAPDYKLDVNGTLGFAPGSSVTPVDNGDVVFELTNNTTLTIKAKGSDGTVRSGTVTLA